MALAIWIGATVEQIHFNFWLLGGLAAGMFVAMLLRLVRRGNFADLRGSWVLAAWAATRFVLTPALFLLGLAWLVCAAFKLSAAATLLKALQFAAFYGCAAIFLTAMLLETALALKGPGREPPSES